MREIDSLLRLPEGPERTAALAAWIQGLYAEHPPVLVGGGAVELYSGGAYVTGDLDFVGEVPPEVAQGLLAAGFVKRGRHWIHDEGQVFVEFPSSDLDSGERTARVRIGDVAVLVLAPEELIVDRLAAWEHWRSEIDGVNAFLVWRAREGELDRDRLRRLAERHDVSASLDRLVELAASVAGRAPTREELEVWASGR